MDKFILQILKNLNFNEYHLYELYICNKIFFKDLIEILVVVVLAFFNVKVFNFVSIDAFFFSHNSMV